MIQCPNRQLFCEIRFTFRVLPFTVRESILLLRKRELGQFSLLETLLYQRAHIEHSFHLLNVIESGFRAGVWRGEE